MARQGNVGREYKNVEASLEGDPGTSARVGEVAGLMGKRKLNAAQEAIEKTGLDLIEGDYTGERDPAAEAERLDARHGEAYLAITRLAGRGKAREDAAEMVVERLSRLMDALGEGS